MLSYKNFRYIFPPRPKNAINPNELQFWDNGSMIGQIKTNGSNGVIFMNEMDIYIYNRHGQRMTNHNLNHDELRSIYSGKGWMVINGEVLNKSKKDELGNNFNGNFIIFDILVHNSEYLVGKTFLERVELLEKLYGKNSVEKDYLYSISEKIHLVKSFESGFKNLFDDLTPVDMIEGVVLKRKNAKLEIGNTENNNYKSQIKSRKVTKNYKF
jgi:ATP-dependent DNA ligase